MVPYLMAEGIYALVKGPKAETSLLYSFYAERFLIERDLPEDLHDANTRMIASERTIRPLLPVMKANGVGLGNSPYSELKTEEASVNTEAGRCLEQKPNLRKRVGFLRTNLFNPFDQMTYFVDADRELPGELRAFFDRYTFRTADHGTNEHGERLTVPAVEAERVVLIAGDSVANGLMLDDSETLASRLQAADPSRRYVNLGIARADASDTRCALERAAERYRGRIDEVLYILCENDFEQGGRESTPGELTRWLAEFAVTEHVDRTSIVYVPYVYNVAPEITRVRGHSHFDWPTFRDEKRRTLKLAQTKGIHTVDFLDLAEAERQSAGTQFGALALYLDHAHWSPLGTERMAAYLREHR